MRCLRTLVGLLLAALLLVPASAPASAGSDFLAVYKVYKRTGGVVDGCKFSAKQLASAKKGVPPDIDTYAPDFPDALDAALERRTSGACAKAASAAKPAATAAGAGATPIAATATGSASGGGSSATPGAAAAPTPAPTAAGATGATGAAPGTTPAPAPEATASPAAADNAVAAAANRDAAHTDGAPLPLVLLAAVLVLALLIALLWAIARFFAWDPPWLVSGRHATAEAGWRVSASWAEFSDWVRFGR